MHLITNKHSELQHTQMDFKSSAEVWQQGKEVGDRYIREGLDWG